MKKYPEGYGPLPKRQGWDEGSSKIVSKMGMKRDKREGKAAGLKIKSLHLNHFILHCGGRAKVLIKEQGLVDHILLVPPVEGDEDGQPPLKIRDNEPTPYIHIGFLLRETDNWKNEKTMYKCKVVWRPDLNGYEFWFPTERMKFERKVLPLFQTKQA